LVLVNGEERPPPELLERYRSFSFVSDDQLYVNELIDWYGLLAGGVRNTIDPFVDGRIEHLPDDHEFLADSLFCEWAYVLNLAERVVECYRGVNQEPGGPGRYAGLGPGQGWLLRRASGGRRTTRCDPRD
jgi:hypothetical protein